MCEHGGLQLLLLLYGSSPGDLQVFQSVFCVTDDLSQHDFGAGVVCVAQRNPQPDDYRPSDKRNAGCIICTPVRTQWEGRGQMRNLVDICRRPVRINYFSTAPPPSTQSLKEPRL